MGRRTLNANRRGLVLAMLLAAMALPATAAAQATRTYVSGTGDDAQPCSRTAPCKTFAGALSKTAASGEIDALDSGGFGAVTITKPLTISATGVTAGVLVDGTNGITIDTTGDSDAVTLRGLDIHGWDGSGLNGIEVQHAGSVRLEDDEIYGFEQGVDFEPSAPVASVTPSLFLDNVQIHDSGEDAVRVLPPAGKTVRGYVTNSTFENNGCGLAVGLGAASGAFSSTTCAVSATGSGTASITSEDSSISGNGGAGVLAAGTGALQNLTGDLVSGNGTGLSALSGGKIVEYGANNSVFGNTTDGSPNSQVATGAVGPQGVQGPSGANGANGTNGANGANGKNGTNGKNGEVELITCKTATKTVTKKVKGKKKKVKVSYQKCTGKLVTGTVKFNVAAKDIASASIASAGKTVAKGTLITSRHEGVFRVSKRLKAGRYTLTSKHGKTTTKRTIVVS